jgi:hypothetical protein
MIITDGGTRTQYATGTLIHEGGRYYLATAYHVLYGKKTVEANLTGVGKLALSDEAYFEPNFYYDAVLDIAVFRFQPAEERRLGFEGGNLIGTRGEYRAVEIYKEPPAPAAGGGTAAADPAALRVVQGQPAIAVGNPEVKGSTVSYFPENITYSCTVSEFRKAQDRIAQYIKTDREIDQSPRADDPERSYYDGLSDEARKLEVQHLKSLGVTAKENPLIFLETLSIAPGFSGGPILISRDGNKFEDGLLVGLVAGGDPTLFPGRFSWACDAREVRKAIQQFDSAPGGGRTASLGRLAIFPDALEKWPRSPYKIESSSSYAFEDQRLISGQSYDGPDAGRELFRNRPGYRLVFTNLCTFTDVDFSGADLSGARFEGAQFTSVNFDGAVLNGATFVDCTFTGRRAFRPLGAYGILVLENGREVTGKEPNSLAPTFVNMLNP